MPSESFEAFGGLHALVVAVSVLLWAALVRLGRRCAQDRLLLTLPLAVIVTVANLFWFYERIRPERFSPATSLPFHLCDLAWMAAAWSLLRSDEDGSPAHQLVFFWGIGLSAQAFVTPTLGVGPAHLRFWLFWLAHWQILAVALLDLAAWGRRPTRRGLRLAAVTTVLCGLATIPFNLRFATNYFFTGRDLPAQTTIIERLGPWPGRLVLLGLLVLGWYLVLFLLFRARKGTAAGDAPA